MPVHASTLYSRNVQHLLHHLWSETGLAFDFEDEIVDGAAILHAGRRRHSEEPMEATGQGA
jgi:NAD/NADP transhydrogenase alpha subunit